jgi:large subunit ribosomal protein L17
MRHRSAGKKLSRTREHRKAMFRNMVTALLEKGKIETTVAKAKVVRPIAEKLITLAKRNNLHAKKRAFSFITKPEVVKKLFEQIAPSFKDRPGGYTRIIRTHTRIGDASEMALLELVGSETPAPSPEKAKTDKKGKKTEPEKAQKAEAKK